MMQNPASVIEVVSVSDLKFVPNNPNVHPDSQVAALARSIRTWGIPLPILVDEHSVVLAGNGTLAGAIEAGLDRVPVCRATGWSEEKKREYVVLDNKLRQLSEWDDDVLRSEIDSILGTDFLDSIGFSSDEIDGLLCDTSSFREPAGSTTTGVQKCVIKFSKHKLSCNNTERDAIFAALESYKVQNKTSDGFVAHILSAIAVDSSK